MTMLESIRGALDAEMERDSRVMVLGQDVGRLGGVFRATDGLLDRYGPARVVDMPLSESAIVGSTVGLAASGLVPVAEIQFLGFAHLAFHQIGQQLARMRYRSQGRIQCQVTIRMPFGAGVRAFEMHSDATEAMHANNPGLKIVVPATAADAKGLLLSSIRDPDPVLFLEPLRGYRLVKDEVPDGDHLVPLGRARVARAGADVTVVAWSAMVPLVEKVAESLAENGVDVEVVDLRTLVPLDIETLVASVTKTGRAVVVQEAVLTAGYASEVIATIQEEAFYSLEAPVLRVAAPDTPYPFAAVEEFYAPTEARVAQAILAVLDR